jgi:hypothetical protein
MAARKKGHATGKRAAKVAEQLRIIDATRPVRSKFTIIDIEVTGSDANRLSELLPQAVGVALAGHAGTIRVPGAKAVVKVTRH